MDGATVCVLIKTTYNFDLASAELASVDGRCAGVFDSLDHAQDFAMAHGAARVTPLSDQFASCRIVPSDDGSGMPAAVEAVVYSFEQHERMGADAQ